MSRRALIEAAKNRAASMRVSNTRAIRHGPNAYECPFCGRYWRVTPTGHGTSCSGFIASASDTHVAVCQHATPEERRAIAASDEARWKRSPPVHEVWNNRHHRGFKSLQ